MVELHTRIVLIGYMGSGKTSTGKELAKLMQREFVDLDVYIEQKYGQTINDIFQSKGENYFREIEKTGLNEVMELENVVISLGGGTPCFYDNMETIKAKSFSIYLKAEDRLIVNRLQNAKSLRPLVKDYTTEQLFDYVKEMLWIREPYYNQADLLIDAKGIKARDLLKELEM
jgi:shikimate kinase